MNKAAILAASLLCLSAGAALAAGDGNGPFGTPDTAASLPPGYMRDVPTYVNEQEIYHAAGEVAPTASADAYRPLDTNPATGSSPAAQPAP